MTRLLDRDGGHPLSDEARKLVEAHIRLAELKLAGPPRPEDYETEAGHRRAMRGYNAKRWAAKRKIRNLTEFTSA